MKEILLVLALAAAPEAACPAGVDLFERLRAAPPVQMSRTERPPPKWETASKPEMCPMPRQEGQQE